MFCLRPSHCLISALYTSHKALEGAGGSFTFSVCTFYRSVDTAGQLMVPVNVPLHPHIREFTGRDRNHVHVSECGHLHCREAVSEWPSHTESQYQALKEHLKHFLMLVALWWKAAVT